MSGMWLANVDILEAKSLVTGTCVTKRIGFRTAPSWTVDVEPVLVADPPAKVVPDVPLPAAPLPVELDPTPPPAPTPALVPGAGVPAGTRARASTFVAAPTPESVDVASEVVPDASDPPPPQATKDMLTIAINDKLKPYEGLFKDMCHLIKMLNHIGHTPHGRVFASY